MTYDVKWREATKRDTAYLRTFSCTSAPVSRGTVGVERQVQSFFRQYAISATNRACNEGLDGRFFIAEDEQGIAAAFAHRLLADKEYPAALKIPAKCQVRDLSFLAVAERYRVPAGTLLGEFGTPGAMADEALNEALWDMQDRAGEAPRIFVTGLVDYRNEASMRMLARNHFEEISRGEPPPTGDNRLGRWMRVLRCGAEAGESENQPARFTVSMKPSFRQTATREQAMGAPMRWSLGGDVMMQGVVVDWVDEPDGSVTITVEALATE